MHNQITLIGKVISLKNNILVLKCTNKIFRINIKNIQAAPTEGSIIAISGSLEPRAKSTLNKIKVKKILYLGEKQWFILN